MFRANEPKQNLRWFGIKGYFRFNIIEVLVTDINLVIKIISKFELLMHF